MSKRMGVSTRIARELEELRRKIAVNNDVKLVDADKEIVNIWNELKLKGAKIKREIVF